MSKKIKQQPRPSAGFITRTRFIAITAALLVLGAGFTVYALSTYQSKFITVVDPPTVIPNSVVTPAPSSEVPSLSATGTGSNSTTSYQSTNWAGYLSTGGSFTAVSGTWVASSPTPTSTSVESGDGTWIGIGGITTSDLIQIGTENTISPTGIVTTSAFYELLPAGAVGIVSLTVNPGNTISASITQTITGQWTISMTNVTTGQSFSRSVSYSSSLSSAEWIQEDPRFSDGSLELLDNFGTVQFSNAVTTIHGTTMSAAASNASQITLIGQGGAAGHGATPSTINGSSFTVRYY